MDVLMAMKFTRSKATKNKKYGISISVYTKNVPQADVCYVETRKGHFQEFYNDRSTFIYYIMKGNGRFYLDGKETKVKATDVLVIPPNTKIYYLGNMKMLLVNSPAWESKHDHHVRYIR